MVFANPCTMQIISKHWTDEMITSPAKLVNAPLIEKYTGVENYKARKDQIEAVMNSITGENYEKMKTRVQRLPNEDDKVGGTNILQLIRKLEHSDAGWIKELVSKLN